MNKFFDVEMSSMHEVMSPSATSENVEAPTPTEIAGRKNLKKGKEIKKKTIVNTTETKTENTAEHNTENESNTMDENTQDSAENKKDDSKKPKTNNVAHPPVVEMVMDSFRNLKKYNGISAEKISEYVDQNYQVNINRVKPYIKRFLVKGVADGLFDRVSGSGIDEKFKIQKAEKANKGTEKAKKSTGKIKKGTEKVKKAKVTGNVKEEAKKKQTLKVIKKKVKPTGRLAVRRN